MADRVDVEPPRPEDPVDLPVERLDLRPAEGHAVEHVREAAVHGGIREGKRLAQIVVDGRNHLPQVRLDALVDNPPEPVFAVIKSIDPETHAREVDGVAALPGAQLQDEAALFPQEARRSPFRRVARLSAEEFHLRGVSPVPLSLLAVQFVLSHVSMHLSRPGASRNRGCRLF